MAQNVEPNLYELNGDGIKIVYSTTSFGGQSNLTYQKGKTTLSFTGAEIRVTGTEIGKLISVTVANIPDKGETVVSVLLPQFNLEKLDARQAFRTIGVITLKRTTIAGPPKGAVETYKAVAFRGTAKVVQFFAQKSAGA